jgi:hypothetical protein
MSVICFANKYYTCKINFLYINNTILWCSDTHSV